MKQRTIFWLLIFLVSKTSLHLATARQTGWPLIRNYSPKEYRGAPQAYSVLEDKRSGIMYFGSDPGLLVYDGIRWERIASPNKLIARALCQTDDGTIYAAGNDHFGFLATGPQGKPFYQSLTELLPADLRKFGPIWSVKAAGGAVYCMANHYVFKYQPAGGQMSVFAAGPDDLFKVDFVYDDAYYVRLEKKGLMRFGPQGMMPVAGADFFTDKNTFQRAVGIQGKKGVLLAASDFKLTLYKPADSLPPQAFPSVPESYKTGGNRIITLHQSPDGGYVLGSAKKGVLMLDRSMNFLGSAQSANGLREDGVHALQGGGGSPLWMGLTDGIAKIPASGSAWSFWDERSGIKGNILSLARAGGHIYAGTSQSIYFLDKAGTPIEVSGLAVGQMWDFLEYLPENDEALKPRADTLVLAASGVGIYQISGGKAELILEGGPCRFLHVSRTDRRRMYSTNGPQSFMSLYYKNGQWTKEGEWEGIKDNIRGIAEDGAGRLWLATLNSGLLCVSPNPENITKPKKTKRYGLQNGLPALSSCQPYWLNGKVLIATEKGFYEHDAKTDRFIPYCGFGKRFCDGSQEVLRVREGTGGRVYITPSSNRTSDIGYLKPDGKGGYDWVYRPFRLLPEMPGIEKIWVDDGGVFWIGGTEGLFRYDEKKDFTDYGRGFRCMVREVAAGDSSVFFGSGLVATEKNTLSKTQTFPYHRNSFMFRYAAPFFDEEERTLYSHKLEGFDEKWSDWASTPEKEYTNIWEGDYTFKVKAKNIYGIESSEGSYAFKISPPWHRAWWAYSLYAVLAGLGVFGVVKWNGRRLEADKKRLEEIVAKRTEEIVLQSEEILGKNAELEQQKEEIAATLEIVNQQAGELLNTNQKLVELDGFKQGMTGMIVHDLKNPLSIIMNLPGREHQKENEKAKRYGKQMLNLVMDILDVQKYEDSVMKLHLQNLPPFEIAEGAIEEVAFLAKDKDISLINEIDGRHLASTDAETLHRVFVNILTNAIKYTPINGKIIINDELLIVNDKLLIVNDENKTDNSPLTINNSQLTIIKISDTGQGIPADKIHLVFQKFGQVEAKSSGGAKSTGLGMTFCKMAIEAHGEGSEIGIESGVGKGTTVWFKIPYAGESGAEIIKKTAVQNAGTEAVLSLSEEEKSFFQPFQVAFSKCMVYEFTELEEVLDKIPASPNENINRWKSDMRAVMDSLNEEKYNALLAMID